MTNAVAVLIIDVLQNNNSEKGHLIYWSIFCIRKRWISWFISPKQTKHWKSTNKIFTKSVITVYKDIKNKKWNWVNWPKIGWVVQNFWVSCPKELGELVKHLGELVFGWVGFWVSCPASVYIYKFIYIYNQLTLYVSFDIYIYIYIYIYIELWQDKTKL